MSKRRNRLIAVALIALSAALPAAAPARTLDNLPTGSEPASFSEVRPSETADSGFAWDDAGIGAGAAVLVIGLGAGFLGTARGRRGRRLSVTGS